MTAPQEPHLRSEDSRLHELLVLVLDRIAEQGLSGASAMLEQHPEHADELRRRLRKLQAAGLLPTAEGAVEELPDRLGDFRLLRPLGSGGMGIVYLARQESLGRDVALKLVRPDQLFFPGARERFRREVEAIARLQDPGIVAIHTVGEESGIPFFAMEHVVGATLTELVLELQGRAPATLRGADLLDALRRRLSTPTPSPSTELPAEFAGSWPDTCVRVLAQVARAVSHAHAHGVLHRDLKSANVMLRQDGRAVVLDFGLAQPRGASRLTRTGAPLGTLHAMAPEQLRAEHDAVDERTDVYALGVLLYELLALRPPFVGSSYDAVARQILDANPTPPSRENASVSWDCETVCLTAMEPDPARRYPSANALLRDLDNLLARRPIEARRPGPWLRVRRFAQRHRGLTGAAAIALLALFVVPVVIALRERSLNAELREAMARAQANVAAAATGLNELLREMGEERLDLVPDLGGFNQRLTVEVARQVEALLDTNPVAFETRLDFADALQKVGSVRWGQRELSAAETLIDRAIALVQDAPAGLPAEVAARRDFVLLDAGLSRLLLRRRSLGEQAYAAGLRLCLDEAEREVPVEQRSPRFRSRFATGLERLGALGGTAPDDSIGLLQRSLELRRDAAEALDELPAWLDVALAHSLLATHLQQRDEMAAGEHQRAEQQLLESLVSRTDGDLSARRELAHGLESLSQRLARTASVDAALVLLERAVEVHREVSSRCPSRVTLRVEALSAQYALARLLATRGRLEDSRRLGDEVLQLATQVATSWSDQTGAWMLVFRARRDRYDELLASGEREAAEALIPSLVADARRALSACHTFVAVVTFALVDALGIEAGVEARHGRLTEAKELLREASRVMREAMIAGEKERVSGGRSTEYMLSCAAVELAQGNRERAVALFLGLGETLDFDPRLRVPQLQELADEPRIAEWLAGIRPPR